MNRREFLLRCLIGGGLLAGAGRWLNLGDYTNRFMPGRAEGGASAAKSYYRLVVLGDPHLPVRDRKVKSLDKRKRIIQAKENVIADINSWEDVDEIVVLGDVAAQFGVEAEYNYATQYFSQMKKPVSFITGNHDYVYVDGDSDTGKLLRGSEASRAAKLAYFKKVFGLNSVFYSHQAGPYRLIYLSPDSLESRHLTEMTQEQLAWFSDELEAHRQSPTIVFFHAPLKDTLLQYNKEVNTPDFIAQPVNVVAKLLEDHSQIRLWVSGHTHTPATNESYAATELNTYAGHVVNIHNADMDRETIWTNSLYLYSDQILIKTFNHYRKEWEKPLERIFPL